MGNRKSAFFASGLQVAAVVLGVLALAPLQARADRAAPGDAAGKQKGTAVEPLFGLAKPSDGPFPADRFRGACRMAAGDGTPWHVNRTRHPTGAFARAAIERNWRGLAC